MLELGLSIFEGGLVALAGGGIGTAGFGKGGEVVAIDNVAQALGFCGGVFGSLGVVLRAVVLWLGVGLRALSGCSLSCWRVGRMCRIGGWVALCPVSRCWRALVRVLAGLVSCCWRECARPLADRLLSCSLLWLLRPRAGLASCCWRELARTLAGLLLSWVLL